MSPSRTGVGTPDLTLLANVSLAELTTFRIGGTARWFTRISAVEQLLAARAWASSQDLPILYLGEGSNVLFSDEGFPGLVIRNQMQGFEEYDGEVCVAGGENLGELIQRVNSLRLSGLESMFGIPGTVAGAILGNAGAYGQEIKDLVIDVTAWSAQGQVTLSRADCGFGYRHSLFKLRRDLFIVSCRLKLMRVNHNLQARSDEILAKRVVKYPPGLRCPGSFFKNVLVARLSPDVLERIPPDFIQHGKIPAGRLLEEVGAKGAARGDAMIAEYHGNLLINRRLAVGRDVLELAAELATKVLERFQLRLEPEILIVGDDIPPILKTEEALP